MMGLSRAASVFFLLYSLLSCLLIVWLIVWTMTSTPGRKQPPNIIIIMADDLGWNDVSFHGSRQIPTPNIDALAHDGIILNKYYVQQTCTPSRAALLTGRYPIHTGLQHGAIEDASPYGLWLGEKLLPEYLHELGYANHIVGKWHLGFYMKEYTPTLRGFDSHFGFYLGFGDYYNHNSWEYYPDPKTNGFDFRNNLELDMSVIGKYSTELLTTHAEHLIANHDKSQPLFLYMSHQAPHSANADNPRQAPQRYLDKLSHIKDERRRQYAGMVSVLDESVGNMTKALANAGLLDNTVIIFTTDNGGAVNGYDNNWGSNWPLRGAKATLLEGGMRAAGFLWSPLLEKSGYTSNHLMHITDWLPTTLSIAGYNMDTVQTSHLDGVDMWRTLSKNQQSSPRTDILFNIDLGAALRVQNWKLVVGDQGPYSGWYPPWRISLSPNHTAGATSTSHINPYNNEAASSAMFKSELPSLLEKVLARTQRTRPDPVIVECGALPLNATSNCNLKMAPCLYDLDRDPCELNNLAAAMPAEVKDLLLKLASYKSTAVPSRSRPTDTRGYPVYHNGNWEPWVISKSHP